MNRRTNEGVMDYEWQNKQGPVDAQSPFVKLSLDHQRRQQANNTDSMAKKRSHSVFDSPTKPDVPSLRKPAPSQTFLFSQPQGGKALPPIPISRNPLFNTPRKFEQDYQSSGPETSPENNPDSDATPDMGFRSTLAQAKSSLVRVMEPTLSRKNSLTRLNGMPGRGELIRGTYSHAIEKKVRRNRRKEADRQVQRRRGSSASDTEMDSPEKEIRTGKRQPNAGPGPVASLFGFIETHPNLPHILSFYAQLLLNVFIVFFIIFIVYSFWSTIRSDVDKKSEEAITEILAEMAVCAQNYRENRCDKDIRVPALETVCNNWERCMNKDPRTVGRARVSAHTFAEIFNSFIEPISYKAMIFSVILIFGCVAISNFAFGFFRNRVHAGPPPMPYVPTPHHASAGQEYYWNQYQLPIGREPAPSMVAMEPRMASPIRRLQY